MRTKNEYHIFHTPFQQHPHPPLPPSPFPSNSPVLNPAHTTPFASRGLRITESAASSGELIRIDASAAADALGQTTGPTTIILRRTSAASTDSSTQPQPMGGDIIAFGPTAEIDRCEHARHVSRVIDATGSAIMPGLVNAHTHLDLTHLGHLPPDPDTGFVGFVDAVRSGRRHDAGGIRDAVRLGISRSLAGGTVAVGDILGAPFGDDPAVLIPAIDELQHSPLVGIVYLEFFDLSPVGRPPSPSFRRAEAILRERAEKNDKRSARLRLGIQPHAPYSVHDVGYKRAADLARELGLRVCTHLAESPEEREFIAHATGLQRRMLENIGVWHDSLLDEFGKQFSPIEKFARAWSISAPRDDAGPTRPQILAAHANDTSDADLARLRELGVNIVYCPRSSAYFNAHQHFGPHRYRDMLAAGVNVCLGTDSVLNLPPPPTSLHSNTDTSDNTSGFGVLDEMRFLYRRHATDPRELIAMGTTRGASALGLDQHAFHWPTKPGANLRHPIVGLLAVPLSNPTPTATPDPARAILESDAEPRLLV